MRGQYARRCGFFGVGGDPSGTYLRFVWFEAGATTAENVGVGSTRAEVVHTYGSKLETKFGDLWITGQPVKVRFAHNDVVDEWPVIYFAMKRNKVVSLEYGARGPVLFSRGRGKTFESAATDDCH